MSFSSKLEYKKNSDNELVAAIYPLREVMNHDTLMRERLGGSTVNDHAKSSRFSGLGIPVGLYLSRKQIDEIQHIKQNPEIHKDCNVIDEDKFNKLLNRIVKKAKKRTSVKLRVKNNETKKVRGTKVPPKTPSSRKGFNTK
jgi:hypothetical protein